MADIALTLAAAIVGIAVSLLILRGVEMCVDHEMRMLQQRSSERQSDRLGREGQVLSIHSSEVIHVAE